MTSKRADDRPCPSIPFNLALVGATGEVGRAALDAIDALDLPVASVRAFASARSAGTRPWSFAATTSASPRARRRRVPRLRRRALLRRAGRRARSGRRRPGRRAARSWTTRPRSAWTPDVPLVVPEVNADAVAGFRARGLVANPSATATALAVALAPLHAAAGLERVVVSTYQSVSGAGRSGVAELEREARDLLALREPDPAARFPHRIAFNLIPHVGAVAPGGATEEEATARPRAAQGPRAAGARRLRDRRARPDLLRPRRGGERHARARSSARTRRARSSATRPA